MRWFKSIFIITWWLLIMASMGWNIYSMRHEHEQFIIQTARAMFDHIVLTRSWNAQHGGVYVPVTDTTLPNEYLDPKGREIKVNDQLTLTKINPAFMTRQIGELANMQEGIQLHITSLNPIRPQNQPSSLERQALELFEANKTQTEYSQFIEKDGKSDFFYMAPLITTKGCMKCHEKQGYQIGDIRGGISVVFPNTQPSSMVGIILWHLLIGLAGSILIMILINRLKQAYYRLQQQTIMDALTGIPNRRYFTERVLMEFRRSRRDKKPLSLIICDIDYFKTYNDHYGHQGGDECLLKVAKTIQAQLHRPGDICARYGGEEFVIILPNTPLSGVLMKAEQIRSAVENLKIEHAQSKVNRYVTISLGAATELQDTFKDHEALIKEADDALYRAKAEGRNRVCTISNVIENTTEPVADV